MSAAELRRAAALMRERAEAVGEGRWESYPLPDAGPNRWTMTGVGVAGDDMGHRTETMFPADAEHIASWHPAVALAVAKAMDDVADAWEIHDGWALDPDDDPIRFEDTLDGGWVAVARAFLGGVA